MVDFLRIFKMLHFSKIFEIFKIRQYFLVKLLNALTFIWTLSAKHSRTWLVHFLAIIVRTYSSSEFVVANTLAKWKKMEPNEINFNQGFSQKLVSTSCFVFNSLTARGDSLVVCW